MLECWDPEPKLRPSFHELTQRVHNIIQTMLSAHQHVGLDVSYVNVPLSQGYLYPTVPCTAAPLLPGANGSIPGAPGAVGGGEILAPPEGAAYFSHYDNSFHDDTLLDDDSLYGSNGYHDNNNLPLEGATSLHDTHPCYHGNPRYKQNSGDSMHSFHDDLLPEPVYHSNPRHTLDSGYHSNPRNSQDTGYHSNPQESDTLTRVHRPYVNTASKSTMV